MQQYKDKGAFETTEDYFQSAPHVDSNLSRRWEVIDDLMTWSAWWNLKFYDFITTFSYLKRSFWLWGITLDDNERHLNSIVNEWEMEELDLLLYMKCSRTPAEWFEKYVFSADLQNIT